MNRCLDILYRLLRNPLAIGGLVAAAILASLWGASMSVDEGIWNYMGRLWVQGRPVYSQTVDNKPPGIFLLYALSYKLFGVNVWFTRLTGAIAMIAAGGVLYSLGRRLHGRTAGIVALAVFGLTMPWELLDGPFMGHTESFMILFVALAMWALVAGKQLGKGPWMGAVLGAGVLMGLAIGFKQVAVFTALAWAAMYLSLWRQKQLPAASLLRDAAIFVVGCFVGNLLLLLPVLASGVPLWDYFEGTWIIPLQAGTGNASLLSRLERFGQVWLMSPMVLFYLPAAAFGLQRRRMLQAGVPWGGLLAWAALDFVAAGASGYYYGHQIRQVVPSLAVAGGIALAVLLERYSHRPVARKHLTVAALLAIVLLWMPSWSLAKYWGPAPADTQRELGLWIKDHSLPQEPILALGWDSFGVLAWSERECPCRHFNFLLMDLPGAKAQLLRDLKSHPPRYLILPQGWAGSGDQCPPWLRPAMAGYEYRFSKSQCDVLEKTAT